MQQEKPILLEFLLRGSREAYPGTWNAMNISRPLMRMRIIFSQTAVEGDLLITMGAGDVVNIGEHLLGKHFLRITSYYNRQLSDSYLQSAARHRYQSLHRTIENNFSELSCFCNRPTYSTFIATEDTEHLCLCRQFPLKSYKHFIPPVLPLFITVQITSSTFFHIVIHIFICPCIWDVYVHKSLNIIRHYSSP